MASSPKKASPEKVSGSFSITVSTLKKGEESISRKPEEQTKVGGKKRQNEKKKIRPEIIIISKKGDMSYADILRKVKTDPELTNLGGSVSRIRRTQNGDLIVELNKSSEKKVDSVCGQVENMLAEQANVKPRKQPIVIECKDLDEVTSRKDICAALREQFNLSEIETSRET